MADESRQYADAASGPENPEWHDLAEAECACDLGADIGSRRWLVGASSLLLLMGITLGLGFGALSNGLTPTQQGKPTTSSKSPFPLTLDIDAARLATAPVEGEQVPVLHTALKPGADWRAPAGWAPRADRSEADQPSARSEPADTTKTKTVAVRRGDTLIEVLTREGAATGEAHAVIDALRPLYDPKRLKTGQDVTLTFARYEAMEDSSGRRLVTIAIPTDVDRDVKVSRARNGNFRAEEIIRPLQAGYIRAAGSIEDSFFLAATQAGVPIEATLKLIRMFSYDVDFQRDLQPDDKFEVLYRAYYDADGRAVKTGDILYARLITKGKTFGLYRYTLPDGDTDYFDENGRSNKKALMRTPIDGARISSKFGMRRHPILGYTRMHRGLDFAAPSGTPIMAAGDGTVQISGTHKGYGRYVRLRHWGSIETAYGHLSRIAAGLKPGARVKQGQIIGYVGQSGLATGPHLHYEVIQKGAQINPSSNQVPINKTLGGKTLTAFKRERNRIDHLFAEAPSATAVARAD